MPATDAERTRLRRKLGGDDTSMPDAYIDDVFDEAEGLYSTYARDVVVNSAYILVIDDMLAKAAKNYDYSISESSDKKSQVFTMLEKLRAKYVADRDGLIGKATPSAVRWGGMHKIPSRHKEYPDA
jgi:hypothetical protein